jgi:hypothetical protein
MPKVAGAKPTAAHYTIFRKRQQDAKKNITQKPQKTDEAAEKLPRFLF